MQRQLSALACSLAIVLLTASAGSAATAAGGSQHSVVVTPWGTVWTWGGNSNGQLGDGTTTTRRVPVEVPNLTGIVAVAAGRAHTLALTSDGLVWAWGANADGQLGDGTTSQRVSPVLLSLTGIVTIAAGDGHSAALASDGTLWLWGRNANGQLGDGTTTRRLQPQAISGVLASAIAAGYAHTIFVRTNGTVWGVGANAYGQLGDGSTTQRTTPVQMNTITDGAGVAAGFYHSLVQRSNGSVVGTGYNAQGQLGDGTWTQRTSPVPVTGLSTVVSVTAAQYQSGAVLQDGTIRTWGYNAGGVLGDGTTTNRNTPIQPAMALDLTVLAFGESHAVAVSTDGVVCTWGGNSYGQLGDGTSNGRTVPEPISEAGFDWLVATPVFSVPAGTYSSNRSVVVTVVTSGAEIHFTLTGVDPTTADPVVVSGGSVLIDRTTTLKARAFAAGRPPSRVATATYTLAATAPTLSPTGGTYGTPPTVSMSTTTPGSTIRYTTNGTDPTESSEAYSAPLIISTSTTLKAATFKTDWSPSGVTTGTYTMNFGTLTAPTLSPSTGTYTSAVTVTLGSEMPGAVVRYTTNGTTPTTSSPAYTQPLLIETTTTVTARAFHSDYTSSASAAAIFTIQVATPIFTPAAGTYLPQQPIVVTGATPGATMRYTLNNADPTETSPVIASGGSLVVGEYTLKARAWKAGCVPSAVAAATYSVSGEAVTPRVAGGTDYSLALRGDGVAWSWGRNTSGQLGDGTTTARLLPVLVNGLTGLTAVAGGGSHSVGLRYDGTIWAWGGNAYGQLGDGTTTVRVSPVQVATLAAVMSVDAGDSHTLALKDDGTVWAWGLNNNRQLGDGTTTSRSSPVPVPGLTGMTGVAAGGSHSLALKGDGTVWAWGNNANGQLGDGTTTARSAPVQVASLAGVVAIAARGVRSLAITSDGSLWQWGQILSTNQTTPQVVPGLANVIAVAAGVVHSMALTADGTVWCWGSNANGQLGDGTLTNREVPAPIAGPAGFLAIGAGGYHSLALAPDGTVWTWGRGTDGQLGDGLTTTRPSPAPITETGMVWRLAPPWFSVPSGRYSQVQQVTVSCSDPAVVVHYTLSGGDPQSTDPVVPCEGAVTVAQSATLTASAWKTGAPTSVPASAAYELKPLPPTVSPPGGTYPAPQAVSIASDTPGVTLRYTLDGTEPTPSSFVYSGPIQVSASATVKAIAFQDDWTPSDSGFASYWIPAGTVDAPALSPPPGTVTMAVAVSLTSTAPGAVLRYTLDGSEPSAGSLLYRTPILIDRTTTVKARAFKAGYLPSAVSAGSYELEEGGLVSAPVISPAGGRFAAGRLVTVTGPAGATLRYTTNGVDPTPSDPEIASGAVLAVNRALVLKVRAWRAEEPPSAVTRAGFLVTGAVAAGRWHTLALASDGSVLGWGWSLYGQVGNGLVNATQLTPALVLTGAVTVAAGGSHSLAIKADGTLWAWGWNAYGQLGDGSTIQRVTPVQVTSLTNVVAIAAGHEHSLALTGDGRVWAWGRNVSGQLGDGTTTNRATPVPLAGLAGATAVSAGSDFSLALVTDGSGEGSVWAWGGNANGQLGDGTTLARMLPVRVIAVPPAVEIVAGERWAAARDPEGHVWTWGTNQDGQLGDGTAATHSVPQPVATVPPAAALAAGWAHALAVARDGTAWAWGSAGSGQLGNGTTQCYGGDCGVPAPVLESSAVFSASAGQQYSHLLTVDGRLHATGANSGGQLGIGTTTPSLIPVPVPNLVLVENDWLLADPDEDGAASWRELIAGTDPFTPDTDGDGVPDGAELVDGSPGEDPDPDRDGVPSALEVLRGTDPYVADSDGDGVGDLTDAFPVDPTRSALPGANPNDQTPPTITVTLPTNARRIGGAP